MRAAESTDGVGGIKFFPVDCGDDAIGDASIAGYGIDQLRRRHARPFLLTIGFHKPHMPWNVPKMYFDMYPLDAVQLPPYRADDLRDIPPAGVTMARGPGSNSPDKPSDYELMVKSGRWTKAVQAYLAASRTSTMNPSATRRRAARDRKVCQRRASAFARLRSAFMYAKPYAVWVKLPPTMVGLWSRMTMPSKLTSRSAFMIFHMS